eukprot:TRINITY_DN10529_c0_g1_i1.p1 TRINITY_DN10529_c0_g1~~TRINITY_DN10529_c0_g1_i1.p1  ORF type:complete len:277 (+),score=102.94 TRINITY_DN10529_c0_g1_i1:83-832(+)
MPLELPTLTVAPEFQQDDSALNQVAQKFKQYDDWAKKLKAVDTNGVAVSQLCLHNVDSIGQRINCVRLEAELDAAGQKTRQPVTICSDTWATVLVVFMIDNVEHALVTSEVRAALASNSHRELVFGAQNAEGGFDRCRCSSALQGIGVKISFKDPCTVFPLNNSGAKGGAPMQLYPGAIGAAPQKWFLYKRSERAEFKSKFPIATADGCTVDLVPLEGLFDHTCSVRTLAALALYDTAKSAGMAPASTV